MASGRAVEAAGRYSACEERIPSGVWNAGAAPVGRASCIHEPPTVGLIRDFLGGTFRCPAWGADLKYGRFRPGFIPGNSRIAEADQLPSLLGTR